MQGVVEAADSSSFARATGPQPLNFPADYGPHPDYQTEWWYYTGNLTGEDGRHFGYQFTLFRRAAEPPSERQVRQSDWSADQIYMGHFALTDVAGDRYRPSSALHAEPPAWPARRPSRMAFGWRIGRSRKPRPA